VQMKSLFLFFISSSADGMVLMGTAISFSYEAVYKFMLLFSSESISVTNPVVFS
jgi:hypothetical protein